MKNRSRKKSDIRARLGLYSPNGAAMRTKPTTGYVGPRTAGAHGRTVPRRNPFNPDAWIPTLRGRLGPNR